MKKIAILLGFVVLFAVSCEKRDQESQTSNISFTQCQQSKFRSGGPSGEVDVEFSNKGVQIMYYNFAVTCDFTTINTTHTLTNGVLNITLQGSPNQANCICYTDVSYTIEGISQNEVNVIFINGVQVYCYNDNYPKEIPFTEYSLEKTPCKWTNFESNKVIVINSNEELSGYINCTDGHYPEIDFSKHTLLLANGTTHKGISKISNHLSKLSINKYKLGIEILLNDCDVIEQWTIALITNKLIIENDIELNIILRYN